MKNIISNPIKSIKKINFLFVDRSNFYKNILFIIFLLFISPFYLSAQKCSVTLIAKNNVESVDKGIRVYFMEIMNNEKEEIEIFLSATNSNSGKNPDNTDSRENVNLDAKIFYNNGNEIKDKIKLKSNELLEFQVKLVVPKGTSIEHWNNTLVSVFSEKCKNYSTSVTLYTFIPNPEEQ